MGTPNFELVATIPAHCVLGEGPVWDHRIGVLWFTDIQQAQLLCWRWDSKRLERFDLPARLGSLGLTSDTRQLVCAFASGFAMFEPATGACDWLFRTEPEYRGVRMNDGRVDRSGNFWAGSMVEDDRIAPPQRGSLYRLGAAVGAAPVPLLDGISISNSICFSPDGLQMYFADTPTQEIVVYDYSANGGSLSNRRIFARLSGDAFPDGSDVDADGRLWNAEWGSGRVTAYYPDGEIYAQIALPVSQPTCVAFGGPELCHLFITTAREGLSRDAATAEPQAGDVFVYQTDISGVKAPLFAG